jgi:hypothetical protein
MVRPSQVQGATALLAASLGLGIVCFVLEWQRTPSALQPDSPLLASTIATLLSALLVFVIYQVWVGRNWARFGYLGILLIGIVDAVEVFEAWNLIAALTLGELLFQLIALYLVFSPPGRDWFRARTSGGFGGA